ncbi:hypothetical protein DB31_2789 [Hyalangium minutum]|uniref:Uncharacterized protein n=1 Tax=Hyalangium minutum TaxID=394096 RepID=A0A085W683_9BACT|nr:hypothetical protein DB31_2789 [Hyalangium minutum]
MSSQSTHARLLAPRLRAHGGTGHWGDGARRPHPSASGCLPSIEHLLPAREPIRTRTRQVMFDSAHPFCA